jgi:hypothetical protein
MIISLRTYNFNITWCETLNCETLNSDSMYSCPKVIPPHQNHAMSVCGSILLWILNFPTWCRQVACLKLGPFSPWKPLAPVAQAIWISLDVKVR